MEKQESKRRFPAFPQPRRLRTITTYGIRILRARSLRTPLAIACKKNQWNRGCKIVGDSLFPVHELLAAFLVYRMQGRKPLPRDVPKGQAEGQSPQGYK